MATAVNSVCSPVSRQKRHPNADSSHVAMRFLLPSKKHKKINKRNRRRTSRDIYMYRAGFATQLE